MGTKRRTMDFELGEEFARVLAEMTQSLVCVLDEAGRVLLFNDACERATGFSRDEVIGRPLAETLIPPEESEAFRELLAFIWSTGHASPQVGHWRTKDGGRRLIAWSNKPLHATAATPAYLVTSGIDLTERELSAGERAPTGPRGEARRGRAARAGAAGAPPRRDPRCLGGEPGARVHGGLDGVRARARGERIVRLALRGRRHRHRRRGASTATGSTRSRSGLACTSTRPRSIGHTRETGLPSRVDDWGTVEGEYKELMLRIGYRSTVAAPIIVAGTLWGAVTISGAEPLPANAEVRLAAFCDLVSLAVASAQAREDLQTSRSRIVRAGDEQRRRLERNLHDGAQQRLVAATLLLRVAQAKLEADSETAAKLLRDAAGELDAGLEELRELARGLHPGALTEHGLRGALVSLEERLPLPVEVTVTDERLDQHVEATAYFIVSEGLNNVVKHARASRASVTVEKSDDVLRIEITDDGTGGVDTSKGTGLLGLRDRAEADGGTLVVISPPGRGTMITATLPLDAY